MVKIHYLSYYPTYYSGYMPNRQARDSMGHTTRRGKAQAIGVHILPLVSGSAGLNGKGLALLRA